MDCIFCQIIAGDAEATFYRREDDFVVIKNKLTWVPVMLLGIPTTHLSQQELWQSPVLPKIGEALSELGEKMTPGGLSRAVEFRPGRHAEPASRPRPPHRRPPPRPLRLRSNRRG